MVAGKKYVSGNVYRKFVFIFYLLEFQKNQYNIHAIWCIIIRGTRLTLYYKPEGRRVYSRRGHWIF
jgi:hypothetical protein